VNGEKWCAFCPVKAACAFCAAAALLARSDTQSIPRSPTPCCKRKNHIPFHGRRAKCKPRFHTPCRLSAEQGEGIEEDVGNIVEFSGI